MCSDGSGDALADLERALDLVADEDLKRMFGPQLLERSRRLLSATNRLAAQLTSTVREGELTEASEVDRFRIELQPDGRWRTYRPDGTEIRTPEPLLAA